MLGIRISGASRRLYSVCLFIVRLSAYRTLLQINQIIFHTIVPTIIRAMTHLKVKNFIFCRKRLDSIIEYIAICARKPSLPSISLIKIYLSFIRLYVLKARRNHITTTTIPTTKAHHGIVLNRSSANNMAATNASITVSKVNRIFPSWSFHRFSERYASSCN